ncbi:hypothetical protein ACFPYJ_16395 [Paenibacillus solisilvae]|uniref:Uncharacterized protein n=1 Tax=Paenibacillus solisilvae TaxID=2486751 RepID=A0ABW0VYG6_9BACL
MLNKQSAEAVQGDFIYRLVTEKAEYRETEAVKIYGELEYMGDKESVTIFHAASPFYFPITEKTRDYEIAYNMNTPLISTVLKKGVPLREQYKGGGGYDEHDDKNYIAFIQDLRDMRFPGGYYVAAGFADFYVQSKIGNEEKQEDFHIKAQIDFSVKE